MKKLTSTIVLILFLSFVLVSLPQIGTVKAEGTIYIRADGTVEGTDKIQRDENFYTIIGDIFDSIVVEKDDVVIDGAGYILQGNGSGYGIHLIRRSHVTIRNMAIKKFDTGIRVYWGSNNTIHENIIANNEWGIYLDYSKNNTISGNNVTNNDKGMQICISPNNVLRDNQIDNNRYNFWLSGVNFVDYVNDVDASNTVDSKPICYWVNEKDKTVPLDAGHVVLVNCTGITVKNLNLMNNGEGILLAFTENSTVTQNTITNNGAGIKFYGSSRNNISANYIAHNERNGIRIDNGGNSIFGNTIINNGNYGVHLYFSKYNTIHGNNIKDNKLGINIYGSEYNNISSNSITNNSMAGLWFFGSHHNYLLCNNITDNEVSMYFEMQCLGNTIYHNNFVNNDLQFFADVSSVNSWDNGVEGNYWSNYNGTDNDADGIGDTPYVIDHNNQDNYPLMNQFIIQWYTPTEKPEPFSTTWILVIIGIIAIVGVALLVFYTKTKKTRGEVK